MKSFPTPEEAVRVEPMGGHFTKFHLGPDRVLHRFSQADEGDPHDHPFHFTTSILSGGYIEDVYCPQPDGTVKVERFERLPGTSHRVEARTIHRLVSLPNGECWTLMQPEPWQQVSGFYRFDEAGIWRRDWDKEWELVTPRR